MNRRVQLLRRLLGDNMKTVSHSLNLLGGLVLLPVAILRLLFWPLVATVMFAVVVHFVVKCW